MPQVTNIYSRDVYFNQVFTCSNCGKKQLGDRVCTTIHCSSPSEIAEQLERIPLNPNNMPVGWGSGGRGFYNCGCGSSVRGG